MPHSHRSFLTRFFACKATLLISALTLSGCAAIMPTKFVPVTVAEARKFVADTSGAALPEGFKVFQQYEYSREEASQDGRPFSCNGSLKRVILISREVVEVQGSSFKTRTTEVTSCGTFSQYAEEGRTGTFAGAYVFRIPNPGEADETVIRAYDIQDFGAKFIPVRNYLKNTQRDEIQYFPAQKNNDYDSHMNLVTYKTFTAVPYNPNRVSELQAYAAKAAEFSAEYRSERESDRERRERAESRATWAGVAAIAGMAANNYTGISAQRRAEAAGSSLPIARVDTFAPPLAQLAGTTGQGQRRPEPAPVTPTPARASPAVVSSALQPARSEQASSQQIGNQAPASGGPSLAKASPSLTTTRADTSTVPNSANAGRSPSTGTLYFMVGVQLVHSRTDASKFLFADSVVPVKWQYNGTADRTESIAGQARPEVIAAFRRHFEPKYPPCSSTNRGRPEGCWGVTVNHVYGRTAEEARSKQGDIVKRMSGHTQIEYDRTFSYQTEVMYQDAR